MLSTLLRAILRNARVVSLVILAVLVALFGAPHVREAYTAQGSAVSVLAAIAVAQTYFLTWLIFETRSRVAIVGFAITLAVLLIATGIEGTFFTVWNGLQIIALVVFVGLHLHERAAHARKEARTQALQGTPSRPSRRNDPMAATPTPTLTKMLWLCLAMMTAKTLILALEVATGAVALGPTPLLASHVATILAFLTFWCALRWTHTPITLALHTALATMSALTHHMVAHTITMDAFMMVVSVVAVVLVHRHAARPTHTPA